MTRPLRVAHVVATVGATGVESYLQTLLPSFDRSRVEPVLFAPADGLLVERLRARGVRVEFGAPRRKLAFAEARRLADRWRGAFDVVHAHGPRAAFWAERAARRAGIPAFVVGVHELRWQTLPPGARRELWIALENRVLERAARIVTVSEATRRDLLLRRPRLAPRTRVVHASAPVLLEADRLPRAQPGRVGGPLRLVTVGRFNWQKGYDRLFEALAVAGGSGLDFTLDVVGFGVLEDRLRRQVGRLGLDGRVRWLGRDVALPDLLADSHLFVTATRAEMFGIAVLEAMAVGLPVLATGVGSLPEVVADGATGVLVPSEPEPTLPGRLARALESLERDPPLRARLGDAAARRARERFGPAVLAEGITRVYRELLPDGAPDTPRASRA